MNKRGVFFLVDALVAVSIIIVAVVLVLNFTPEPQDDINDELNLLNSFMDTITQTQMQELNGPLPYQLINESLVKPDATVYIAIGDLYRQGIVSGNLTNAKLLTQQVTRIFQNDSQRGIYYAVNGTMLYNKSMETFNTSSKRVTKRQMTFFTYGQSGEVKLYGPVTTEVSFWIGS